MAYFVVVPRLEGWQILDVIKIDLRTAEGLRMLNSLQGENEIVMEVSYNDATLRQYVIVEGEIFWAYKTAPLKSSILRRAVVERMRAEKLRELLEPRGHLERRQYLTGHAVSDC